MGRIDTSSFDDVVAGLGHLRLIVERREAMDADEVRRLLLKVIDQVTDLARLTAEKVGEAARREE